MPKKSVLKSKRVLEYDELTTDLVGKHLQFFNGDNEDCWSKIGICSGVSSEEDRCGCWHIRVLIDFTYDDGSPGHDSEQFTREDYSTRPEGDYWAVYLVEYEEIPEGTSNIGRTTCWYCGCSTEMRRDFSDMSIREFCPRCKV